MADEQPIGADDVARKQFATAFRGFDQYEVRTFLAQVAAELGSLNERERALRERLAEAEAKPPPREVGEDELEAALGVETTRVLHAAREAAAEIRAKAEESVGRLLREANDEASRMRSEAETVLSLRTEEADAASAAILAAAEETAAIVRADAAAAADAAVAEAQQQGRDMVAEAQAVRERVLKDLARRRKAAATQLEQLLAGRERLLGAYDVVRTTLDEATRELTVAEREARAAADAAGLRAPADEEPDDVAEAAGPEPVAEVATEPAPVPEPEPEAPVRPVAIVPPLPEPEPPDDRRSSSLRLLRRKGESTEVPLLEDDVEGVRLVRADAVAAPRPVVVPDPEPEVAVESDPASAPEVDAESEKPVDDLFARLRADREAAVAKAEQVLAPAAEPEAEPEVVAEPEPVAADDTVFEARDAVLEPAERALTRALKRALADEQNEVLDNLRRLRGTPSLEALLPDVDEHAGRFSTAAVEHLRTGAEAGAASFDGDGPGVDELAAVLAADVTDDVRARLERALDANRGDDEALIEAISATYREWKTARSEPLARHHVAAAYAFGVFTAVPGDELVWVVDVAEGGCADCDDNALAGPTRRGQAFPTGQVHPPAHAGCRCLVLPAT
ncbi:MAG: hypothetical protein JWN67_1791 [Actinomycetia bacterium]|nr:hypothetical protein [Actinomycetes bacterium]